MLRPLLIVVALGVLALALGNYWYQAPRQTAQSFVGHLSKGRYVEAASLVEAPAAITSRADGGLAVRDRSGTTIQVDPSRLPFLSYGPNHAPPGRDFAAIIDGRDTFHMMARGVVLTLTSRGGSIVVERVEDIGTLVPVATPGGDAGR